MARRPSPALIISFVALLVALSGIAWAAQLAENSVKSKQIKDGQVKDQDLADGAVTTVKLADGSIVTGKVLDESLVGDDLADETVTGSKIVDGTITSSKVEDGTLSGADVENDSLDGLDIDEASLAGVALTSGDDCCTLREENLALGTAYSPSDPATFVNLGAFELRTSTTAGEIETVRICKLPSSPFSVPGIVSMSGVRSVVGFGTSSNTCLGFDINGASTSAVGDFEVMVPSQVQVWGKQFFSGEGAEVVILEH